MTLQPLRLGVNIDHVATVRNARGGDHPDPARVAALLAEASADGITIHLREDRRHIRDGDLVRIRSASPLPINLEMAATTEMLAIALEFRPHACCLVPERREERTTEGGLDVAGHREALRPLIGQLKSAGIRVSLFISADDRQIEAASALNADIVEFHTGPYCHAALDGDAGSERSELTRIQTASRLVHREGIEVHAGHGLSFDTVRPVAAIPEMRELNIGHFLIGEALFVGLPHAIATMRGHMNEARARVTA
jgi:pyridoxine 5-phosphate synthase